MFSKSNLSKYFAIVSVLALVLGSFFVVWMTVLFCLRALLETGLLSESILLSTVGQVVISLAVYGLTLCAIIGVYRSLYGPKESMSTLLATTRRIVPRDIVYVLAGYGVYFVASIVVVGLSAILLPGIDLDEKQNVGFENVQGGIELGLAFVVLVVLAPLVEEVVFRGFLFGRLRKKTNFFVSAFLTSLAFAVVHLQLNVGIDVFVLSIILCYLREKTGAIWASVCVHMMKNALAFAVIFLYSS